MGQPAAKRLSPAAYPVARVGNVLELISLLEERRLVKVTDVSSRLGVGTSTAHRLLTMFRQFGFVEQEDRSHAYRVGPGLLAIAHAVVARQTALTRIRPFLESLVEALNETIHVATLRGTQVVYIDCVESRKSERATPRTGRAMPAYATASGKALLARLSRTEIEALFPSPSLVPVTAHTHGSRADLLADLGRVRQRGFAINRHESQVGYFAAGCTVPTKAALEPVAIVIAAPSQRFRKNRDRFTERLCKTAEQAGKALALVPVLERL